MERDTRRSGAVSQSTGSPPSGGYRHGYVYTYGAQEHECLDGYVTSILTWHTEPASSTRCFSRPLLLTTRKERRLVKPPSSLLD
jgi:hypothetical protein